MALTILLIISNLIFLLFFIRERLKCKFYLKQWFKYENLYYTFYKKWIEKLTPEEIKKIQNEF